MAKKRAAASRNTDHGAAKKQKHDAPAPQDDAVLQAALQTADEIKHYTSLSDFYNFVISEASSLKDEGEVISGPFLKLPSKKLYPDYYSLIENPISFTELKKAAKRVCTLSEFKNMWIQLKDNAETYNAPDSLIVKDANTILTFVLDEIAKYETYATQNGSSIDNVEDGNVNGNGDGNDIQNENENENENADTSNIDNEERNVQTNKAQRAVRKANKLAKKEETQNDDEKARQELETDDTDEDYTPDLIKVFKHLLSFKISHHKNSVPLSKILMNLPDRNDPSIEDYYDIVTEPMCFNMIGEKLDNGYYNKGSIGSNKFIRDINLIFDNVFDVFGDGPYYKAATGLSKAFDKRLEKFNMQVLEKKKQEILNMNSMTNLDKSKSRRKTNNNMKIKDSDYDNENLDGFKLDNDINMNNNSNGYDGNKDEDDDGNNNNLNTGNKEDIMNEDSNGDGIPSNNFDNSETDKTDIPSIIRKHDIEKAEKIEEIDDITAFIKKFIICSTLNLDNVVNNLKTIVINSSNNSNNSTDILSVSASIFENIIIEPAGNSTVGGSTYVLQIPGSSIIGHDLSCIIYLQNKIIEEKYITELKINGEIMKGIPINTALNEEDFNENESFLASKYGFKLGFGLNYFEFTLKVPYPLKSNNKKSLNSEIIENKRTRTEPVEEVANETETERKERLERGRSREFTEHVKVWLKVAR